MSLVSVIGIEIYCRQGGDTELETVGDASSAFEEMSRGSGRTHFPSGGREDFQPAIEMRCVDGQGQMNGHGLAMVATAHQGDG